ncbi:protein TPR3 isoform X3 [Pyrus x bretschneideri]|uniref:protein TPR3 isoform X3 n=1 Tax=Pyrus x bretschneideri TaxID=225117 RepID=UPI00202E6E84|nr:protein TPR3 isoform X3 [Pyrus x bretschneideri]
MDFHPVQHTLLLGTNAGDISLWEVSSRDKLMSRSFQVWDIGASSMMLKATLIKDPCVSVKRILWSPMVLYLELHIQLYSYFGGNEIHQHLEFFFSTSVNGKIKAWLYDNMGYRVDYDAPGHNNGLWCRW